MMKHLTRWQESICIWHCVSNGLVRRRSFLEDISQKGYKMFFVIIRHLFSLCYSSYSTFFVFNQISEATLIYELFIIFGCSVLNHILFFTMRMIVPKKWQEILNKIGLIFAREVAVDFSSLFFCFSLSSFSFFILIGLLRKLARDSRKFLVTFFLLLFFFFFFSSFSSYLFNLYYAQDSFTKWQDI